MPAYRRTSGRRSGAVIESGCRRERTFTTVPDEPRNDRVQHNTDFAKNVQWHGLSRPRRPPFCPGEVLGVGIDARTFYRTCSRIESPRLDILTRSIGVGVSLSGFLRRFRLCPLAGLSFGHVLFAFHILGNEFGGNEFGVSLDFIMERDIGLHRPADTACHATRGNASPSNKDRQSIRPHSSAFGLP